MFTARANLVSDPLVFRRNIMICVALLLPAITINADAEPALNVASNEALYTPISVPNALEPRFATAVTTPHQAGLQQSSSMPKFDLTETASRYAALVREADRMSNLTSLSPQAIEQALATTSQVSGKGLSEGAGSYAVVVAANQRVFASGLQTAVNMLGRDVVLDRLKNDPDRFLAMISGVQEATRAASGALQTSQGKLERAREVLGEAAYSVQSAAWSQHIVDTPATLAAHRNAANMPIADAERVNVSETADAASDAPINNRFLVAAAYKILGEDNLAVELLDKPLGRMCMNRVQLNVRQCLAASQYPYEHLFCLSKHSFGETLGCVQDVVK